jgi:uncharacterized protein (TIGR03435 family)
MSRSFLLGLAGCALVAWAQAPIAFEVATIKPVGPLDPGVMAAGKIRMGMKVDHARVEIGSFSLADMIRVAYRLKPYQVLGPDWIRVARFDVQATLPEGASPDQAPEMLQTLLADRFKLTIHRENKEQSVYAIVTAKGGPKLKESAPGTDPAPPPGSRQVNVTGDPNGTGMVVTGGPNGAMRVTMGSDGIMHLESHKMTMEGLADSLARFMDRPVVDLTGIKGNYEIAIDLSMDDLKNMASKAGIAMPGPVKPPAEGASEPSSTSIFTSVQNLGLKLESRKAPVTLVVVDHAEKTPTEN